MNPHILEDMEHMPHLLGWLPFVMMVGGFLVSYTFYIRKPYLPVELANTQPMLYKFALRDFRLALRYDENNAEARGKRDQIVAIYQQMGRPVPDLGNEP